MPSFTYTEDRTDTRELKMAMCRSYICYVPNLKNSASSVFDIETKYKINKMGGLW